MNAITEINKHFANVSQAADLARCNATVANLLADALPRPESASVRDAHIDEAADEDTSDNEIIDVVMATFNWSYDEATKRMRAIDYAATWEQRVAELEG